MDHFAIAYVIYRNPSIEATIGEAFIEGCPYLRG